MCYYEVIGDTSTNNIAEYVAVIDAFTRLNEINNYK